MNCVIERVIYSEYDTSTGVNSIRARLICDDQSDLPAQSYDASTELMIGCEADVIADGSRWLMDSTGTWVQQLSKYSLDLTGYVLTTTYNTDQAAQDAVIADKWGYTRSTIGGTGDFNIVVSSGYYRYNGAPANAPTGASGEFGVLMVYAAGSYISQIAHCFLTSRYGIYIRSSTNTGATWTAWTQI